MKHRITHHLGLALAASLWLAGPIAGQFENPEEKIREIAEQVAEQMQEIDRLLLQSNRDRASSAAEGIGTAVKKMDELLKQTSESQQGVVTKIDELIEQILKAQQQNQGGSGQGQEPPPQAGRPRTGERPGRRQRSEVPEGNQRPEEGTEPRGPEPNPQDQGQNQQARSQPQDPTEKVDRNPDAEGWGDLQQYDPLLKSRGSRPRVPEKYRRYFESFVKRANKSESQRRRKR